MWLFRLRKFLKTAGREALLLLVAFRHPATPFFVKLGTVALLAYLVSPIDLIPDWPVLGWIDDAAILMFGIPFLLKRVPAVVLASAGETVARFLGRFGLGRFTN